MEMYDAHTFFALRPRKCVCARSFLQGVFFWWEWWECGNSELATPDFEHGKRASLCPEPFPPRSHRSHILARVQEVQAPIPGAVARGLRRGAGRRPGFRPWAKS